MNNIAFLRGYLQKEASKGKAGKTVLKSFGDLPDIVDDVADALKGTTKTVATADDPLKALVGKPINIRHPLDPNNIKQGYLLGINSDGTLKIKYHSTQKIVDVPAHEVLDEALNPWWTQPARQKKITLRETPAPAGTPAPAPTSAAPTAEATEAAATAAMPKITMQGPKPLEPRQTVQLSGGTSAPPAGGTSAPPPAPPTTPPPTTPAAGGADDAAEVVEAATEAGSPAGRAALALIGSGALGGAVGYGAGMATSPTQTDLNNEVRKMELAESKKLLNMLKAHRIEQQMERPGAGKSLYI